MNPQSGNPRPVPRATRFPFVTHRAMSEVMHNCHCCGSPVTYHERDRRLMLCTECYPGEVKRNPPATREQEA